MGFGTVELDFSFLRAPDNTVAAATSRFTATGTYLLVAGQEPPTNTNGPRLMFPSDGAGVYDATVTFDPAGLWTVTVRANVDGQKITADASLEVFDKPINPFPGEPAPRTQNRLRHHA